MRRRGSNFSPVFSEPGLGVVCAIIRIGIVFLFGLCSAFTEVLFGISPVVSYMVDLTRMGFKDRTLDSETATGLFRISMCIQRET